MPDLNQHTALIRQLLRDAFSDDQIMDLALDHFPEVYDDFGLGMGKGQKIRALVDAARRAGRLADVLSYVRTNNPFQYNLYAAQLAAPDLAPAQSAELAALSARMSAEFEQLRRAGGAARAAHEAALAESIRQFAAQSAGAQSAGAQSAGGPSAGGQPQEAVGGDKLTLENVQGAIAVGRNATVNVQTDPALMQQLIATLERIAHHLDAESPAGNN